MKELVFLGDSLERLRDFPEAARKEAGVQLHKVQQGLEPSDWKPMASVGQGMREIRIRDEAGAFRVLYITRIEDAVFVLHAFQKKTQQRPDEIWTLPPHDCGKSSGGVTMVRQSFSNVWDALENTPAEAASMAMRSNLLIAIEQRVRSWQVTQAEAARRLGITQPRLNDLLRGRITNFSLDTLINLASQAGLTVRLDIAEAA